jgi:hypothetical protein
MNQIRNKQRTPRTVWFGLFFLMLTGFLIAGYAVQSGALAGPQEKKPEKKDSDMKDAQPAVKPQNEQGGMMGEQEGMMGQMT